MSWLLKMPPRKEDTLDKRRSVDMNASRTSEALQARRTRPSRIRKAEREFRYNHANAKSVFLPSDEQRPIGVDEHDKENHSEQSSYKSLTSGSGDGSFMKVEAEVKAEDAVSEIKSKKHRCECFIHAFETNDGRIEREFDFYSNGFADSGSP